MKVVILNRFPIYLACMFVIIFVYLPIYCQGSKVLKGLMYKLGNNKSEMHENQTVIRK